MSKLSLIEGIGEAYEKTLKEAGVTSVENLLKACATKKARDIIAEKSGIAEKLILKWANHADLFRIRGVAGEYAELLEAAGVAPFRNFPSARRKTCLKKFVKSTKQNPLSGNFPRRTRSLIGSNRRRCSQECFSTKTRATRRGGGNHDRYQEEN